MRLDSVIVKNYLPYAKHVIMNRAIPAIDGLKPGARCVLYTMYRMGLNGETNKKSQAVVGQVMGIHPHGDGAIYDTIVRMVDTNEALNVGYIKGKSNFGKVYSSELPPAAPRYTELRLSSISKYIFNGIDEDAVDMVPNFDGSTMMPTLLPVQMPTIIINTSSGIAVGTSSNIPSFNIKKVCLATIGILKNKIQTNAQLAEALGVPELPSGCMIHTDKNKLENLIATGRETFTVTGKAITYKDRIEIVEIPSRTVVESIINDIENCVKSGEMREVSDVSNLTDLNGLKLVVALKRGSDPIAVLNKLYRNTNLRMKISFVTRYIYNNECVTSGIFDVLKNWIEFRKGIATRQLQFKLNKEKKRNWILKTWVILKDDIEYVARQLVGKKESEAVIFLKDKYELDDEQCEYVLETKLRNMTLDNVTKRIAEYNKSCKNIDELNGSIANIIEYISKELEEVASKYNADTRTIEGDLLSLDIDGEEEEEKIDDREVAVVFTSDNYVKRIVSASDEKKFFDMIGTRKYHHINIRNNSQLVALTRNGEAHKIDVDNIDASRSGFVDRLEKLADVMDVNEIIHITEMDKSKILNIVYASGRACRLDFNRINGNRKRYKSLYLEIPEGERVWITDEDSFFIVTNNRKLKFIGFAEGDNTRSYRGIRLYNNECIAGLIKASRVPNLDKIDLNRYTKDYGIKDADGVIK